jgi:uncharacterized damage-inducible protein DinB
MADRKTRDDVLRLVGDSRAELEAALARVPAERFEEPLLDGGWTVKDLLAHVTYWEWAFLSNIGEPPPPVPRQDDVDVTNRAVYEFNRARPLADVRREFESTHRRLLERISEFDHDAINSRPMEDRETVVWQFVAGETWEHYPEHIAQLERAGFSARPTERASQSGV